MHGKQQIHRIPADHRKTSLRVTVCDRSRQTESENERYMSFHRSFSFAIDTYMIKTFHYRFLPLAAIPVLLF